VSDPSRRGPIVEVEDLTVRFGGDTALDRVTFSLDRGAITGLVGPNGAGKTTLLRVLATLLEPDSGRASVDGLDVVEGALEVRRRIGYQPDAAGLYQDMKVEEYLRFFADAHGRKGRDRDGFVARALEIAGLGARAGDFVEDLSLGMRERLAFARTLAGDPRLLLLDEPFSGLDPVARADLRKVLLGAKDEGRSVLVSSHLLWDLERLCDRVLFVDRGRLVDEPTLEDGEETAYELGAVGDPAAIAGAVTGIAGVAGAAPIGRGGLIAVTLSPGTAPQDALAAMVEAGIGVVLWRPADRGLEDRFVRAVAEGEP